MKYARRMRIMRGPITAERVEAFIEDAANDHRDREGLLQAWNRGLKYWDRLPTPRDLAHEEEPAPDAMEGIEFGAKPKQKAESAIKGRGEKRNRDEGDDAFGPRPGKRGRISQSSAKSLPEHSSAKEEARSDSGDDEPDEASRPGGHELSYSSGDDDPMDEEEVKDTRKEASEYAAPKLKAERYRSAAKVHIELSTGFSAEKRLKTSAFVEAVPKLGVSSAYKKYVPDVAKSVGGDANLATLLDAGLMNMAEFKNALKDVPGAARDQVQYLLVLMINEVIGRSTANLIEVMATLRKTMKDQTSGALLRRMLERCLYVPTRDPESKSKVGGSKLSKIGRNRISVETLEKGLRDVFKRNSDLYGSLAEHLKEDDPAKLAAKFKPMYDQFIANIEEHVTFRYED